MLKKDLKFVLSRKNNIFAFYLSLILLLAKINFILIKQKYKKDALMICSIGYVKIIFILLVKIVAFYMQTFII